MRYIVVDYYLYINAVLRDHSAPIDDGVEEGHGEMPKTFGAGRGGDALAALLVAAT